MQHFLGLQCLGKGEFLIMLMAVFSVCPELQDNFQEVVPGLDARRKLLDHSPSELDDNLPLFLLNEDIDDTEVYLFGSTSFNSLFDCVLEISQDCLHVDPSDPHILLVFYSWEAVYCSGKLLTDLVHSFFLH